MSYWFVFLNNSQLILRSQFVVSAFCEITSKFHKVYPLPPFNCPALSPSPPAKDVRHLRPTDIKVMMALGDSITAGFGMVSY